MSDGLCFALMRFTNGLYRFLFSTLGLLVFGLVYDTTVVS